MTRSPSISPSASDRQHGIEALVERDGYAEVGDVARLFHVSTRTVRADFRLLEAQGGYLRTRGALELPDQDHPESEFDVRLHLRRPEKRAIAREAADLVHDEGTIALDASTTALYLAQELRRQARWSRLRVVTNGLRIARELSATAGVEVLVTGGRLRDQAISLVSGSAFDTTARLDIQTAFVGAIGLTVESGLFEATHAEATTKANLISEARKVVGIVDSSKWGRRGAAVFCPTSRLGLVVSDGGAPPSLVAALERLAIPVRLAYKPGEARA